MQIARVYWNDNKISFESNLVFSEIENIFEIFKKAFPQKKVAFIRNIEFIEGFTVVEGETESVDLTIQNK